MAEDFLRYWYFAIREPETNLSKVNAAILYFVAPPLYLPAGRFVQPGLHMISERDDQYRIIRQHSRKSNVVCCYF